ncbi:MAG: hypothetical protein ACM3JB_18895 [Acidobacteriaceae bacterium]
MAHPPQEWFFNTPVLCHGTGADDLVAGTTAQRLWPFEETSEDCGSEPFGTWICPLSSLCADSNNGKKV